MGGIVTVTVATDGIDSETMARLDAEALALGLKTTLPQTEGGDMPLPAGTYGAVVEAGDQMEQVKHYYRSLVAVMRKLNLKGRYFVNVAQNAAFVCGGL